MWMLESHDHTSWWKYGEDHGHDVPGYAWRWVFKVGNRWKFWSLEAIPQPRGDDLDRIRDRTIFEHIFPVLKNVSHPRHPYDHGKLTQIKKYVKIESTFQVADKSTFSSWWLDPKISGALELCGVQFRYPQIIHFSWDLLGFSIANHLDPSCEGRPVSPCRPVAAANPWGKWILPLAPGPLGRADAKCVALLRSVLI